MDKKLPKVFANKIDKNLENNENYFYSASRSNDEINIDKDTNKNDKKYDFKVQGDNVAQKINSIFSSPKFSAIRLPPWYLFYPFLLYIIRKICQLIFLNWTSLVNDS